MPYFALHRSLKRNPFPTGVLAAIAGLLAASVFNLPLLAADIAEKQPASTATDPWIVSIGAMGTWGPRWDGASTSGPGGMPSFSFRRASEPEEFSAPDDNFDFTLFSNGRLRIGPVAALRSGRFEQGSGLAGIRNYPWTLEAGAFVEFWPIEQRLRLRAELRHGVRDNDGFVADLMADFVQPIGRLTLSGGPRLALADARVMGIKFGVSPVAALRNGTLPAYDPNGGVVSVGMAAAQSYTWSEEWTTTAYQRYDYLVGEAAHSPIVRRAGSRSQFTLGLGATYSFKVD